MQIFKNIAYGEHRLQELDIFQPDISRPAPIVIFWHGGSWKSGSRQQYRNVGQALAAMGFVVFLPSYRLYPEVKYPKFLKDCAAAAAWVHQHGTKYGGDRQKIFLMGHSAGAYNAAMVALADSLLETAGVPRAAICGFIGLSGAYDFYPRPDLRPIFPLGDPGAKWLPIDHAGPNKPPSLLIHGRLDFVVKSQNSWRLNRALKSNGNQSRLVIYPHLEHMGTAGALLGPLSWLAPVGRQVRQFISANS
jgi:acetyl esterase/lipase